MGMFDYFVGQLKCPSCESISPPDDSTNMQTKIQQGPDMNNLGVGDQLDVDRDIESCGYRCFRKHEGTSFKLIESWECPNCDKPYNCALINVVDGRIADIAAVELTEETIRSVNYVFDECSLLGWHVSRGVVSFKEI